MSLFYFNNVSRDLNTDEMIAPRTEIKLYIKNINDQDNKSYLLERERDLEKIFLQERNLLEYENKYLIANLEKNYHNNLILFEETEKNIIENEKKVLSQTYVLYDKVGIVKLTCVSELERYVNIVSQFTIFSEKSNEAFKYFIRNNKKNFLQVKKKITLVKKIFLLTLRKLDGTPPKFCSDKMYISLHIGSFFKKAKCLTKKATNLDIGEFEISPGLA